MQFFTYYVFWPFVLGAGFIYLSIMGQSPWSFLIIWLVPWLTWPIGKYRRRMMNAAVEEFKKEAEKEGEVNALKGLALTLGPVFIMFMSAQIGAFSAPVYMEAVGIDIEAKLEEVAKRVERDRHQEAP